VFGAVGGRVAWFGRPERRTRRAWAAYEDAREAYRVQRVEQLEQRPVGFPPAPADRDVDAYEACLESAAATERHLGLQVWGYQDIIDREA
jgi:hypothetical protein